MNNLQKVHDEEIIEWKFRDFVDFVSLIREGSFKKKQGQQGGCLPKYQPP